ncbi:MAG: hypothetical protein Q7U35_05980 [Methanobacteriaceae archaeon]|nr:hypothetical protein [Methanobacteriaceae archaeon]MDP2836472.1 hypothetical protein [Methanobacteriaceae archaeon]MDP3034952.1 hypothetical protein [Methanobacteriaceae archaeon]MDP3485380.1 hypothetical protein [Methanobacteriaceae archaeon]MDP3623191.1 hypothetical protein [Methanobacteriaceae archaeon]
MKRVTIAIDSDVDLKFRKKASQKYQFEKGWYSNAVADAMKDWAEDKSETITNHSAIMDYVNPENWENLKLELNLDKENPFKNLETIISQFGPESENHLKIDRTGHNIIIKLESKTDFDIEANLKSLIILHLILNVIISSLEETTHEKYKIVGAGQIPELYIKKV